MPRRKIVTGNNDVRFGLGDCISKTSQRRQATVEVDFGDGGGFADRMLGGAECVYCTARVYEGYSETSSREPPTSSDN
jgi:hypothetical protein